MEAPDLDELEWMAQQQESFPLPGADDQDPMHDDLERYYLHEAEAADSMLPPLPTDAKVPPEIELKKRALSRETEGKESSANKRGRTIPAAHVEENDWVLPEVGSSSPSNPEIDACIVTSNSDAKLPRRRLADIEGDFMPITDPSGDRVYSKLTTIPETAKSLPYKSPGQSHHGLLSEPFSVLVEQIDQEALRQACKIVEDQTVVEDHMIDSPQHEQLWVEKYAPKSFTELLSDEQTNREVLRWLKQWDKCVFGGEKTSTSLDVFAALKRHAPVYHGRQSMHQEKTSSNSRMLLDSKSSVGGAQSSIHSSSPPNPTIPTKTYQKQSETILDRPKEKVLLLCGPPGLGKTTLAHVAAKHCGYRVVEINASDDRVASTLQSKILDAIQMRPLMGDMRPNCVIIDEIDGALGGVDGKGAIDALLKIAYSDVKEKENMAENGQVRQVSKKRASSGTLSRPVICICNDLYAPALRQLRQMAKVHVFVQPSTNRVVTRLKYICNLESYKVNARALAVLAEHTECDIRSCLNTLQFLKRKQETLNMVDVASQVIGRKDMTSSAFDVWGEVLQKRLSRSRITVRTPVSTSASSQQVQKEFFRLYDLLANYSEYELINDGIHENLLHLRYHDSSFDKTVKCLDLLGDSEMISHLAFRRQLFALNVYQPVFAVAIRHLVAQPEKPHIEWPKTSQRFKVEHAAKKELLKSWMMNMHATTHSYFTAECIAWDLVSPLLYILSPQKLRPVAPQLLSQSEKEEMNQLIDTMINYGLNYKIPKLNFSSDGFMESHGPVFDPPIHKIVQFKDYRPGYHLISSTLRQVLSHEVELERIRRESAARMARATAIASDLQGLSLSSGMKQDYDTAVQPSNANVCAIKKKMNTDTSNIEADNRFAAEGDPSLTTKASRKPPINYFAQFRKGSGTSGNTEKASAANEALARRNSRPVFFKFNEGFTNAIRRPMLVRDFI